jgi:hypothetical protein
MEVEVLRERLHEYINAADEQHLSAIYVLVEDNIPTADDEKYGQATLSMFYQRRENHLKGISKSYSVEEAMNIVRQHKK